MTGQAGGCASTDPGNPESATSASAAQWTTTATRPARGAGRRRRRMNREASVVMTISREDLVPGAYGGAIMITGKVQVSQCSGFPSSPSALSTETVAVYWPLGTVRHWLSFLPLPVKVVPSQVNQRKSVGVALRGG
jgi:hypothetical protein